MKLNIDTVDIFYNSDLNNSNITEATLLDNLIIDSLTITYELLQQEFDLTTSLYNYIDNLNL